MLSKPNPTASGAQRVWFVVLLAALGAFAGYGYALLVQPTYVARAYVVAVGRTADDNASAVSHARAYAKIVSQGEVVLAAVTASGGGVPADQIRRQVHATADPDGPVIEIAGSSSDAQRAADLANLVAAGMISVSAGHGDRTRVDLVVLSDADPPADPVSPRPVVDVAVGTAVGLLLAGLVLLTIGQTRTSPGPPSAPKSLEAHRSSGGAYPMWIARRSPTQLPEASNPITVRHKTRRGLRSCQKCFTSANPRSLEWPRTSPRSASIRPSGAGTSLSPAHLEVTWPRSFGSAESPGPGGTPAGSPDCAWFPKRWHFGT